MFVCALLCLLLRPRIVQYKSLWALTNIAAGNHEHAEYLVGQGAAPEFVRLMSSNIARLREQACWALGNIAGDCAELRDEVLAAGAMNAVLEMLRPDDAKLSAVKTATWTMSNLCRGKPPPAFNEVRTFLCTSVGVAVLGVGCGAVEVERDGMMITQFYRPT